MIETSFWNDAVVRSLDSKSKLVFLNMITSSGSHVSGVFYLPPETVAKECGYPIDTIRKCIDTLCEKGLIHWDSSTDTVWVKRMLRHQGRSPKIYSSVAKHLRTCQSLAITSAFLEAYPVIEEQHPTLKEEQVQVQVQKGIDTLSIGYRYPINNESTSQHTKNKTRATRGDKEAQIALFDLAKIQKDFPSLNVSDQFNRWNDWMDAHGKTFKNYSAAFRNWLRFCEDGRFASKRPEPPASGPVCV